MHIKSIKISGFKSFYRPITIDFPSNFVVLVGPNGCGKSNIIDAVRWVLGESSATGLRSDSLGDTIFNGTDNYAPVGRASIELTFTNTGTVRKFNNQEYIKVRRSLERNKDSHYYINNTLCRRRDIEELFAGMGLTGKANYAIITQGTVHNLVESKPEHIRLLIEEAANITEYLQKRKETLSHIRNTRTNLKQISVALQATKTRMNVLEKQAQSAQEYKEIQQQLKYLKKELSIALYQELESKKEKIKKKLDHMVQEMDGHKQQANELMVKREELLAEVSRNTPQVKQLLAKQQEINNRIVSLETSQSHNKQRIKEQENRLKAIITEKEHREKVSLKEEKELKEYKSQLKELRAIGTVDKNLKNELLQNLQVRDRLEQEWQDVLSQVMKEREQKQEIQHRLVLINSDVQLFTEKLSILQNRTSSKSLKEIEAEYSQHTNACMKLERSMQEIETKKKKEEDKIENTKQHVQEIEQKLIRTKALLHDLAEIEQESQQEGNGFSKFLALWSEHIDIPEGWEKAIDHIAYRLSRARITENLEGDIKDVSRQGTKEIALVETTKTATKRFANIEPLANMLKGKCIPSFFSHIYPCQDLSTALNLRKKLETYESLVCISGEWIGKNWAFINYENKRGQNLFVEKRKKRRLVEEEYSYLKEKKLLDRALSQSKERIDLLDKELGHIYRIHEEKMQQLKELNIEQERENRNEIIIIQKRQEELALIKSEIEQEIKENTNRSTILDAKKESLEDQRGVVTQKIAHIKEKDSEQSENNASIQHQREELLRKTASLERSLLEGQKRRKTLLSQEEELLEEQKKQKKEAQKNTSQKERLLQEQRKLEEKIGFHQKAIQEYEREEEQVSISLTTKEKNIALIEKDITQQKEDTQQLTLDLDRLISHNKDPDIYNASKIRMSSRDISELIRQLERKLDRIGEVNQLALREYEEIKKEYQEKELHQTEIRTALRILEKSVRRIDKKTSTKYASTLKNINAKFNKIFSQLTSGGTAFLEESSADEEKKGIRIMARSRGRRKTSISSLSGGEKTVVALALIMAIFHLNPSPFCLMDEADAMLDDENIMRFNNMIADMSKEIQFLLITHNKTTIQHAQHLIGITMAEPGISQVVSVDMNQAMDLSKQVEA